MATLIIKLKTNQPQDGSSSSKESAKKSSKTPVRGSELAKRESV